VPPCLQLHRVGTRRRCVRCLAVGSALRAALGLHSQVPGLGPQVPGSGVQHQGQVQARLFASHFCTRLSRICTFALRFRHPPPGAATRHPKQCDLPLSTASHFFTGAPLRFAPLHGMLASLVPISPCPLRLRRFASQQFTMPACPPVQAQAHVTLPACPLRLRRFASQHASLPAVPPRGPWPRLLRSSSPCQQFPLEITLRVISRTLPSPPSGTRDGCRSGRNS
jgi:hypothetical protein